MPVGVLCNVLAVATGGVCGALFGNKLPEDLKEKLNLIFGCCSMSMGVATIVLMETMPAVVLSVIIGTLIGVLLKLGERIEGAARFVMGKLSSGGETGLLVTAIVLFCASGTGVYGAFVSGMTGDHSILITKSILDFFTALIFACNLGLSVSLIAVPQGVIMLTLFLCAGWILPLTTPAMVNDFKACGGFIMLATGLRIARIKNFPIADMLPAMVLVMPVSWLWVTFVAPLLAGLAG